MPFLVTKEAPDFTAKAIMPDNSVDELTLSSYRGKYVVLFFYPYDFTFVCPTEVLSFSKAAGEFNERECQVLGVSVDSKFVHKAWVETRHEDGGLGGDLEFPLLADLNKNVARDYGILLDAAGVDLLLVRSVEPL